MTLLFESIDDLDNFAKKPRFSCKFSIVHNPGLVLFKPILIIIVPI